MPNCEGRSRRSGVILYSYDNGHFMAYTSPPPTAEPLLNEKPFDDRSIQQSPIAAPDFRIQPPPRASAACQFYQLDFHAKTGSLVLS